MLLFRRISTTPVNLTDQTSTHNSAAINLDRVSAFSVLADITDATPANTTFVDGDVTVGTDTIAETGHGMATGLLVTLTTTGTLPTGLNTGTNYYVIRVDADNYQLASSLANALAGTPVDITGAAGGGTHTVNVTALSATLKLQLAHAEAGPWVDLASASTSISGTQVSHIERTAIPAFNFVRVQHTISAGQISSTVTFRAVGEG